MHQGADRGWRPHVAVLDGLTDMIDDAAIAEVLGRPMDAQQACAALVAAALEAGGRDNVTAVIADYLAEH